MVVVSVAAISTTITMIIVCLEAHATADSMVMTTEIVGLLETTTIITHAIIAHLTIVVHAYSEVVQQRRVAVSAPTRSFGDNVPSRSFGNSAPSRSFGGESAPTRSFGGGGTTQGSHGVFGGRR